MEKVPIVFSLKDGARRLGICERKFHQEVLDGKVDVVKIGKRRLITADALSAYIARNTVSAFDAPKEARRILGHE